MPKHRRALRALKRLHGRAQRGDAAAQATVVFIDADLEAGRPLPDIPKLREEVEQGQRRARGNRFSRYGAPFPACLRRLGFKDVSWGNDAAGRAALNVGDAVDPTTGLSQPRVAVVWCAEREPDQREYPDMSRFHGYVCPGSVGEEMDDDETEFDIEAETESDLNRQVRDMLARAGAPPTPRRRRHR